MVQKTVTGLVSSPTSLPPPSSPSPQPKQNKNKALVEPPYFELLDFPKQAKSFPVPLPKMFPFPEHHTSIYQWQLLTSITQLSGHTYFEVLISSLPQFLPLLSPTHSPPNLHSNRISQCSMHHCWNIFLRIFPNGLSLSKASPTPYLDFASLGEVTYYPHSGGWSWRIDFPSVLGPAGT